MNVVVLIGRNAKEGELRFSTNGVAFYKNTLAVRRFGSEEADFINYTVFKKQAENCANYTKKGSQVAIKGSIQVRSYEQDGQKKYVTEIIADSVEFLTPKSGGQSNPLGIEVEEPSPF